MGQSSAAIRRYSCRSSNFSSPGKKNLVSSTRLLYSVYIQYTMLLTVHLDSDIPVYRQIVNGIRPMLLEGAFTVGQILPPVRQLASDLGVHFNTVAEAYRLLADEGWLELRRGRGAVVVDRQMPPTDAACTVRFTARVRELIAEFRAAGVPTGSIVKALRNVQEDLAS